MPKGGGSSERALVGALVVLAGLVAAAWWLPRSCVPRAPPPVEESPDAAFEPQPAPIACAPRHDRRCHLGDLWWFDSCGRAAERSERCPEQCSDGRCVPKSVAADCASLTPPLSEAGRCDGDTLRYCYDETPRAVDCAARHQRCAADGEGGWNCMPVSRCPLPPTGRCENKQLLLYCDGDAPRARRCDPGQCEIGADRQARCVIPRVVPINLIGRCRGCDCADGPLGDEVCDGYDNNRDGTVDEGVTCPAIEVVAIVLRDEMGQLVATSEQIAADVARANRALAEPGHDTGLQLHLREVRDLARPSWLDMDEATIAAAEIDPEIVGASQPFFLPVLYARQITVGAKQVGGLGTLPNHSCADVQLAGPSYANGLIVLAPTRAPTAFAHELGHFLGLCHTHMTPFRDALEHVMVHGGGGDDQPLDCPTCARTGDGICDTPTDPGAGEGCALDARSCAVTCPSGDAPDPANLMSYYTRCRRYFTVEQAMHMRRNLWRRTRWRDCTLGVCACGLDGDRDGRCDSAASRMKCDLESGLATGRCAPAGSGQLFDRCHDSSDCGADLLCAVGESGRGRCATACLASASGCDCVPFAPPSPVGVCALGKP